MEFEITNEDLQPFIRDLEAAGGNAEPLVSAALTKSTNKIQSLAREGAAHRTGTLQRSIQTEVMYPEAHVSVEEKYGIFIEDGTGVFGPEGRPIVPKSAKVLMFMVGGKKVFARSVKGMRPRPFFKPAIENSKGYIDQQFDKVVDLIVKGLANK